MRKEESLCFSCRNDTKKCNALFYGKLLAEIIQMNDIIVCSGYVPHKKGAEHGYRKRGGRKG
ncbi:hypothetical protein [Anaerotignum sp. MB30-C6]|uniref:hypothetical protein n=1 Tax=Anaerotignum sp. MB30-C6 TaxID=3070814 RepID=UPI0027DB9EA9|nr:hypothetical protein [Anaerotignum sp. MB30-C6]WMI82073.1 hypothetical protein RBQ60_04890 [Anaerotignum sp. MB30-C6]